MPDGDDIMWGLLGLFIIGTFGFAILVILSKLLGWGWIE